MSQVDREKIAEFSDGNFRAAGVLAQTVGKGETLGSLKSRELFERIFRQRLRYFVAVEQALNFTKAAMRLHLAQPTHSQAAA